MKIHEYQAKSLLRDAGVKVLEGRACFTVDEVRIAAQEIQSPVMAVKSQIHAGGRGAGYFKGDESGKGGVRIVSSSDEAVEAAEKMLGQTLITRQTDAQGKTVKRLYLEAGCRIKREIYFSLLIDRAVNQVIIMASAEGGMDIEELAQKNPEKILKCAIDPVSGIQSFHCRKTGFALGFQGNGLKLFEAFLKKLYGVFIALDASLIEINPLIETEEGEVIALDAKIDFDDNALFRHPQLEELRDEEEEDPAEREADKHQLNYIHLDGSIGCMVNGAGLAMATMDIVKLHGGSPANFLDVGGGATRDRVAKALEIILHDPSVKGILVNIFGGIMRCDIIAEGIVAAAKETAISVPLVVRLNGTNARQGRQILQDSGLKIIVAEELAEAAKKIVTMVERA